MKWCPVASVFTESPKVRIWNPCLLNSEANITSFWSVRSSFGAHFQNLPRWLLLLQRWSHEKPQWHLWNLVCSQQSLIFSTFLQCAKMFCRVQSMSICHLISSRCSLFPAIKYLVWGHWAYWCYGLYTPTFCGLCGVVINTFTLTASRSIKKKCIHFPAGILWNSK